MQATKSPKAHRLAVAVFFFMAGLCFASWASRIPDIKLKLGLSDAGLGAVLFALPIGLMLSLPLSGWAVTRFSSKTMVTIAAVGYPLMLVLIGTVSATWQLAAVLFCFGVFGNLYNISANTQAVGVESLYQRSVMATFHGIWSLAGFSGAAIGTFLIAQGIEPLHHFLLICIVSLVVVLLAQGYILPNDKQPEQKQPLFAKPDAAILKLGLIAFGCLVCEGTMFDWSGVYFQKVVGAPKEMVTLGYTVFMATMATGRFLGDRLVTRFGIQRMLQISGIIISSGLAVAVLFPTIELATAGFFLVGLGVSSVVPLVYSAAGKSKTMSPGVALAAVSTIGFLGFLIGPPLIGFIAELSGLRWSFTIIAIIGFSTTIMATLMKWER
ncbi:MFS transporter [Sediminibacterium goheungense]|uniref:Fucose permease n=1 Tax=Sediminibacterium goheungense TaxID=1086393 RepID=A0A4R6IWX2_9BACT|nr:MFS transporter [Sediminibacterium goheungense]TDO27223.1 fucose permease [Sediminibacterium goheungense]